MSAFFEALRIGLLTPHLLFQRDAVRYYDFLGDDVIEGHANAFRDADRALWLNLGYWAQARSYPEAAAALASLLAEHAALSAADRVLDVGFGFAEQDLLWVERYGVAHITGINLTPLHVQRGVSRVRERGLSDRIDLRLGSATDLPFQAESFDKVTALECAHHFQTRETFFAQALRVLKPGGRLAIADGLPLPGQGAPGFAAKLVLRRWAYPRENFYDRERYCEKLRSAGFTNVRCRSIREQVFPGIAKYAEQRRRGGGVTDLMEPLTEADVQAGLRLWENLGVSDYVIITADKP